jgi:tetratricopeptide (TPR) repeat protein
MIRSEETYLAPLPPDWPIPPVFAIADELGYTPLAHELWQDYRFARLFAETSDHARQGLFHKVLSERARERQVAARQAAPELGRALSTFAALRGKRVREAAVTRACTVISDWATEHGYEHTALEFARAAAAVSPNDPEAANLAALALRRAGDWARAERFYSRAIALARHGRKGVQYICGHIGMAALLYSRGIGLQRAVGHLNTAARSAERNGRMWLASHVLHDSMLLRVAADDYTAAEAEAEKAAELYPLHDNRFPYFVLDFAFVQLEQFRYTAALPLLDRCVALIGEPAIQALIHAMLARCYAGMGRMRDYVRACRTAVEMIKDHGEHAATVHYHIAEASRACRSWPDAERHAARARELAVERGDRELVRLADRSLAQAHQGEEAGPKPTPASAARLAAELKTRLSTWTPSLSLRRRRVGFRNQWLA